MKKIEIFQENNKPVILYDFDDTELYDYTKKITKILEASNVTIIETSSGCFITRPHKLCGLLVTNEEDNFLRPNKIKIGVESKGIISKKNEEIETITDGVK